MHHATSGYILLLLIAVAAIVWCFNGIEIKGSADLEANTKTVQEETARGLRSGAFDRPAGQSW